MFLLLFLVGTIGFVAMIVLSFGHGAAVKGSHHVGSSHSGHVGGNAHHSTGHVKFVKSGTGSSSTKASVKDALRGTFSLSPLDIFAYCMGAGATGLTIQHLIKGNILVLAAIVGALALNLLIFHPLMSFLLRFASTPSKGIEGTIASVGEATCGFDREGRGIVQIGLDGQLVQLLATLEESEHHRGVSISRGDKVVILEVDSARNRCKVSRDLSA